MISIVGRLQAKYFLHCAAVGVIFASIIVIGITTGATAQEVEDQVADIVSEATEERIEQAMEDLLDDIESRISEDSLRIQTDHWLVMAEAGVFVQLEEEGYLFDRVSELAVSYTHLRAHET